MKLSSIVSAFIDLQFEEEGEIQLSARWILDDFPEQPLDHRPAQPVSSVAEAQEIIDQWLERTDFKVTQDHLAHPLNDLFNTKSPWFALARECVRLLGPASQYKRNCLVYERIRDHGHLARKVTIIFGFPETELAEERLWRDENDLEALRGALVVTHESRSLLKQPLHMHWARLMGRPRGEIEQHWHRNPGSFHVAFAIDPKAAARLVLDYFSDKSSSL